MKALVGVVVLFFCPLLQAKIHDFVSPCDGVKLDPPFISEILEHAKVHRFYADNVSHNQDARVLFHKNVYTDCFVDNLTLEQLQTRSELDLEILFHTLYEIAFYTKENKVIQDVAKVVEAKHRYKEDLSVYVPRLFGLYVAARTFDQAQALKAKYSNISMPQLPNVVSSRDSKANVYELDETGTYLIEKTKVIPEVGPHVVVVSKHATGVINRFLTWVKANAKIKFSLAKHSTWLIPQTPSLEVETVLANTASRGGLPNYYVKNEKDWPDIHYWGALVFYFYQDGKLVSHMKGWSNKTSPYQLKQHFKRIDLIGSH